MSQKIFFQHFGSVLAVFCLRKRGGDLRVLRSLGFVKMSLVHKGREGVDASK